MTSRASQVAEENELSPLNHQQPAIPDTKFRMDAETKKVLTKIIIDVVLLGCGE